MKGADYNLIDTGADQLYFILRDQSTGSSRRELHWQEKKINSIFISKSYKRLGEFKKSSRMLACGTFLEFKEFSDGSLKLHSANFCRMRLCPMCMWRRSLKIFGQVSKIMDEACKEKEYAYLFLTLTVKNCNGSGLSNTVTAMMEAYRRLFDLSRVKKAVKGAFRALEVTHNVNKKSKSYDTYHPHFHCILMVNKSYFKEKDYIDQEEWANLWQKCMSLTYVPIVHIEKVSSSDKGIQKAIAEVAKYSTKDTDILNMNSALQDSAVRYLDEALSGRRLISFRGEFAKIQKRLELDDPVDGDLVHCDCDDEQLRDDLTYVILRYRWNSGYFQYCQMDDSGRFVMQDTASGIVESYKKCGIEMKDV